MLIDFLKVVYTLKFSCSQRIFLNQFHLSKIQMKKFRYMVSPPVLSCRAELRGQVKDTAGSQGVCRGAAVGVTPAELDLAFVSRP